MTRWGMLRCVLLAVTACGGSGSSSSKTGSPEQPEAPTNQVDDGSGSDELVAQMTSLADQMCACEAPACAEETDASAEAWRDQAQRSWESAHGEGSKPPDDVLEALEAQQDRLGACRAVFDEAGITGLAACDHMVSLYEQLGRCDKIPQASRDAMQAGLQMMRDAWGEVSALDDATRQAYSDGCQASVDGILATLAGAGC